MIEDKLTRKDWYYTCANCGKDERLVGEKYCRECYEEINNNE